MTAIYTVLAIAGVSYFVCVFIFSRDKASAQLGIDDPWMPDDWTLEDEMNLQEQLGCDA